MKRRSRDYFHGMPQAEDRRQKGQTRFARSSGGAAIGVRGLRVLGGRVNEEYRRAMGNWSREVRIYLEMRDDVTIGTMMDAVKLPLLAAQFDVIPAPQETPGDVAAADWLLDCMNRMHRQSWRSHVSDCLDALDFGFNVSEIVIEKRADGRIWIKNLDPRGQETLERWKWKDDKKFDELEAFVQRDPTFGTLYEIPIGRCVHITFRGRKGNPQGKSILSSLYRPWRMCKDMENLEAVGVERDVGGMPVAHLPEGQLSPEDRDDLEDALKGMRNDENSYLILPDGVKVEAYGGGTKQYKVSVIIERKQKEILGRVFAQFLKLGMDNVGTQALVKGSQDFFTLGLEGIQSQLLEAWNEQLVPFIMRLNTFAGMTEYPRITWEQPGNVDFESLVNALKTAADAKLYTPTDADEDMLRQTMNMPELPDEERGQPREPEAPGGIFPGMARVTEATPIDVDRLAQKVAAHIEEDKEE